jgi:hypothetical protein
MASEDEESRYTLSKQLLHRSLDIERRPYGRPPPRIFPATSRFNDKPSIWSNVIRFLLEGRRKAMYLYGDARQGMDDVAKESIKSVNRVKLRKGGLEYGSVC